MPNTVIPDARVVVLTDALPAAMPLYAHPLDPTDILDFAVDLSKGTTGEPLPILEPAESVASFTVAPNTVAVAAGLAVRSADDTYPDPTIAGLRITYWLGVDPSMQAAAFFSPPGIKLGIEITITTTSIPPRRKQRTVLVTVAQQ